MNGLRRKNSARTAFPLQAVDWQEVPAGAKRMILRTEVWRSRLVERNRHYNILHGAMQSLALNMFQPFLGIFAIRLGGSNTSIALLSGYRL